MKKAVFLLAVLIFSVLYYEGVFTGTETFPLSRDFFSAGTPSSDGQALDLKGIWFSKSKSPDPPISSMTPKELDQIYQLQLDKGVKNVPLLSSLLIREAKKAREEQKSERAVDLLTYAVRFSPDLPQPHLELAWALWRQDMSQPSRAVREMSQGITASFRRFPSSVKLFYDAFYVLCNAVLMAFLIFGIAVMVKYLPLYFYDIRKNMTSEVSMFLINWIKILILLVPFFLGLDMLWAVLFWSLLLWGFITKQERRVLLLFLVVLVYLPFFLRSSANFLDGKAFSVLMDLHKANDENWDRTVEQDLKAWSSAHPEDAEVLFTLGLIEKRQGRYAQAEVFYQDAIQQSPRFSDALSNLGNVYLAKKQVKQAIGSYEGAVKLDRNKGSYHFNLHRAYSQETLLSGDSGKAFQRARQMAPKLVDFYASIDSLNPNRLVIDETLGAGKLWGRLMSQVVGKEGIPFRLFKAWFEGVPSRISFVWPVLFLAFLIGISKYGRANRFLARCPMCGSPTYRFYVGTTDQDFICFNCHRIFIQKEKLHPRIAQKKSVQVREFQRQNQILSRFLSIFFVGFAYVWGDRPLKGLLLLSLFFIFILRFVYWNGMIPASLSDPAPSLLSLVLWGGAFLVFYLFSLQKAREWKPRSEMEK